MSFLPSLVRKPYFALALTLFAAVSAALSLSTVPVALYPSVARPAISVTCTYPGANAREVMNTVAGPLEEKVNGVEGMSRMTSTCSDTGAYSLTVFFHIGVDRDMALTKVQGRVQQALSLLPQEVKNTGVTVESGSSEELGVLTLRSAGGKLTREQVVDYAFGVVNPAILRVPGVGSSTVKDNKVAMRIWLDEKKMAAHGISSDEVVSAIKSQNVQASLGSVGASPTQTAESRIIALISKGRLDSAKDFQNVIIRTEAGGGLVRLGDIARVEKGLEGYTYSALYDETPAVYIRIVQLPGVDVRRTMRAIKTELARLEPSFPGDLTWDMTYDTTRYMEEVLENVSWALTLSFLLSVLLAFAFLRSLRGTMVVALSALVSAAFAFAVLSAAGYFVNLVVLYAFVLAIGLSVAFAAMMVARILELMAEDKDAEFAASLAVARYASRFAAAAVSIALAMIPVALVDGLQGVFYRQFSIVLSSVALASGVMALVLVPAFSALVLRRGDACVSSQAKLGRHFLTPFVRVFCLVACGVTAWGLGVELPKEFIPAEDMGVLVVDCKAAEGTSMPQTVEVMRRIYSRVRGKGGVLKSATLLGESVISGNGENNAKTYLVLDDWSKRDRATKEIFEDVRAAVADIPDAMVYALTLPPLQGQGSQGGLTILVQSMEDADPVRFANEMQRYLAALKRSPLVEHANCGTIADVPHLRVHVDREKCELMKVPMLSLYTALQHALGSVYVNDINLGTQVNRVTVMSDWDGRSSVDRVGDLYVRSQTGDMVPVSTLATFSEELGVRDCYRCNKYLYATAQFYPKKGVADSEAIAEIRRISAETLPRGYLQDWSGLIYEQFQSRGDTKMLMALSVLSAYVVLMVLFGSAVRPLLCLLPTVMAILGGVVLHFITGVPMSLYSQFAILLLVLVLAALSVLVNQQDSGLVLTFLPLVLFAAVLPLALSWGAGSAGSRSFGLTLAGGFLFYAIGIRLLLTWNCCLPRSGDGRDNRPFGRIMTGRGSGTLQSK